MSLELEICLADLRLTLAQRRFARALGDLVRKYRPDQPRMPSGVPEGGQWTIDLGSARQRRLAAERVRVAQLNGTGLVDLRDHEGINGAHAISDHVGKTDDYLLARVGGGSFYVWPFRVDRYRHGSFSSLAAANRLVSSTLARNSEIVSKVARGELPGAFVTAEFGSPTGREAFSPSPSSQPYIRITTGVGVLIAHDPNLPNGYLIQTAYPRLD